MTYFSDSQEAVSRFGNYIDEFQHAFQSNDVDYGKPDDFFAFARSLNYDTQLRGSLSSVAKSVMARESKVPLRTILTIIAVASGGPEVATSDRDMSRPVNLLIDFLIHVGGCSHIIDDQMIIDDQVISARQTIGEIPSPATADPQATPDDAGEHALTLHQLSPDEVINPEQIELADFDREQSFAGVPAERSYADDPSALAESLTRLEINNLQLKHYLDSIDQRISRMEPRLENMPLIVSHTSASRANSEARFSAALPLEAGPPLAHEPLRSTPSIVSETQSPSELQPPVSKPREALSPNRQILLAVAVGLVILFTGTIFYMSLARGTNHTDAMTANQAVANTVSSGLAPDAATAATDSSTHHANTTRGANSAATVADPRPKSSAAIPANPTARRLARPDSVTNAPSADGTSEIAAVRDSAEPSHADTPMPSARSGTFGLPWRSGRLVNVSSGVMAANLVAAPMPAYPKLASLTRMQGNVIMQAIISKKGTVESVRVLKGHRLLRSAAISAVRGWRYRPYLVSGRPVEVATIVSVDFSLQH